MDNEVVTVNDRSLEVRRGDIVAILKEDRKVSLTESPEEFAAIVSRSGDLETINAVMSEINGKRTPPTVRAYLISITLFVLVAGLAYILWPKPPPLVRSGSDIEDAWIYEEE